LAGLDPDEDEEDDDEDDEEEEDEDEEEGEDAGFESVDPALEPALSPLVDDVLGEADVELELDERESVMYQPLPLNTMPTGWMILRSAPPHCSHVVSGGSEKLWRFSTTSLQAVQVYV
jgi:hypothetical protein